MKKESTKNTLSDKEMQFCYNYISTGNALESAIKAGYTSCPWQTGAKLLLDPKINEQIQALYEEKKKTLAYKACSGYERLAFGSISDAVRLLYIDDPDSQVLEKMDLFNISEIKRVKGGGMEIKFFDRIKALEKLENSDINGFNDAVPFYRALEQGVKALENDDEGWSD